MFKKAGKLQSLPAGQLSRLQAKKLDVWILDLFLKFGF
jgi:hypothetical protein